MGFDYVGNMGGRKRRRRRVGGGEKREGNWAERGKRAKRRRESGREPQANFPITGYLTYVTVITLQDGITAEYPQS